MKQMMNKGKSRGVVLLNKPTLGGSVIDVSVRSVPPFSLTLNEFIWSKEN